MPKSLKKLRRPRQGRVLGGVALAFAKYLDVDVVLVRLLWVMLLLPGGLPGLIPYLVCWLVIPEEN